MGWILLFVAWMAGSFVVHGVLVVLLGLIVAWFLRHDDAAGR